MAHTITTAGASAAMLSAASLSPITAASCRLNRSIVIVKNPPMPVSTAMATWKVLCTRAGCSLASATEIIRESATGKPAVASVRMNP